MWLSMKSDSSGGRRGCRRFRSLMRPDPEDHLTAQRFKIVAEQFSSERRPVD